MSRATARKAIEALEQSGRVVRMVGKGTFVGAPRLQIAQPHLLSFTEEMNQRGITPGSQVLGSKITEAPPHVREHLHLGKGEQVLRTRRLRTGDGQPVLYVTHYLPTWLGLDSTVDFGASLYEVLEHKCGITLDEAVHSLEAGLTDEESAQVLELQPGAPVLRFERVVYDRQGRAVVYEEGCARADRYRYQVRLKRR